MAFSFVDMRKPPLPPLPPLPAGFRHRRCAGRPTRSAKLDATGTLAADQVTGSLGVDQVADLQATLDGFTARFADPAYAYFPVWARTVQDLQTNNHDWSFGESGITQASLGVAMPLACELVGMRLIIRGAASVEVRAMKNGVTTSTGVTITNSDEGYGDFTAAPLAFAKNDFLNFWTLLGSTSSNGGPVTAHFRHPIGSLNTGGAHA